MSKGKIIYPILVLVSFGCAYFFFDNRNNIGEIVFRAILFFLFFSLIYVFISIFFDEKIILPSADSIDDSWVDDVDRKILSELNHKKETSWHWGDYKFSPQNNDNLANKRKFLREKINEFESRKREFIRMFEPLGKRRDYKKISENYSQILTEYDEALSFLSLEFAEIEQKIRGLEKQEISEKRGTPEFETVKEKYIPPTQPDWD